MTADTLCTYANHNLSENLLKTLLRYSLEKLYAFLVLYYWKKHFLNFAAL